MKYVVSFKGKKIDGEITLDGSKSVSNRLLLMRALCGQDFEIQNLSTSQDTKLMSQALSSTNATIDAADAGTTFRFMTAYCAVRPGTQILTGSDRMKERPIGILVDALRKLGAKIEYLGKEGYPPLKISSPSFSNTESLLSVPAHVSSQFISALLMIGPYIPGGLKLQLEGNLVSSPYIFLTISLMRKLGIRCVIDSKQKRIDVEEGSYKPIDVIVEADWSAASYYYSMVALSSGGSVKLNGLIEDSLQGDSSVVELMSDLGVETMFEQGAIVLNKQGRMSNFFEESFLECPDLAQTIVAACAGMGVPGIFRGLQTLRIKETDRVTALKNELGKVGVKFEELPISEASAGANLAYSLSGNCAKISDEIPYFETYKDHRMAMALTPLAIPLGQIIIENPPVVEKSYPDFWTDIQKLGFEISEG